MKKLAAMLLMSATLFGCTKVGSEAWCNDMNEKPKGDWTTNEAKDFTKHCIF